MARFVFRVSAFLRFVVLGLVRVARHDMGMPAPGIEQHVRAIADSVGADATCDVCGLTGKVGDPIRWSVTPATRAVSSFCWSLEDGYCVGGVDGA